MSSKVFKTVAMVGLAIGATLLAGPAGGFIAGALKVGAAVGTAIATVGISIGVGLISKALGLNKAPKIPNHATERLHASLDLHAPRKMVLGRTAMATDVRYQAYTGSEQEYLHWIVCVASHPVEAIEEIWFDTELAWSAAAGVASKYVDYLQIDVRNPGAAGNGIAIDGVWTASATLTGCAYFRARFKLTGNSKKAESPFSQKVPTRITVRGQGAKLPDPRQGTVNAADQASWAWFSDDVGRNPALQLLFYLLGWRIGGRLAVGRGIPPERLDLASFATAANICDEPVALAAGGTEPRYRAGAVFSEGDDPSSVITMLCAAMNASLRDHGGKISLHVLVNDLADPGILELGADDILGNESWRQTPSIEQTFNAVRGRYTDTSNAGLYQLVEYPEVALPSIDGIERTDPFELAVVESASQAQRLAKQRLQRMQYPGLYSADFGVKAWRASLGKVVKLTHPGLGWSQKLFRVIAQGIRADGVCPLVLQEEHASIHAWAAGEAAAVVPAAPTAYDPLNSPIIGGIDQATGGNAQTLVDDTFGATYWNLPAPAAQVAWAASRNRFGVSIPFTASTDLRIHNQGPLGVMTPARQGRPLFLRLAADPAGAGEEQLVDDDGEILVDDDGEILVAPGAAADFDLEVGLDWLDINGDFLSRSLIGTLAAAGGAQTVQGSAVAPAGAAYGRASIGYPAQTGKTGGWVAYEPWLAEYQPAADNTGENQVVIVPPLMPVIRADYQGVIDPAQFPKVLTPQITRGGISIRTDSNVSHALANISSGGNSGGTPDVSVNNVAGSADKGRVTLADTMAGSYTFDHLVTVDGIQQPAIRYEILVEKAAPPTGGGGGGGGGGGVGGSFPAEGTRASDDFFQVGMVEDVVVAGGQSIQGSAPFGYSYIAGSSFSGSVRARAKWAYAPAGTSSWTDFGAYVEGTDADWFAQDYSGNPGSVICNQSAAPAAGTYDVRLMVSADRDLTAGQLILGGDTCTVSVT